MGCHCAEISAQFFVVHGQCSAPPKWFSLLMGEITWESVFRLLRGSQWGEDWLSVWWKFTIIMEKRNPGTVLPCLERSVRAHQQKWQAELLNGRVPGRQRQPSTAQVTESVITHAGDSLATPNPNILLASQGVQAWNNSHALRTYKS